MSPAGAGGAVSFSSTRTGRTSARRATPPPRRPARRATIWQARAHACARPNVVVDAGSRRAHTGPDDRRARGAHRAPTWSPWRRADRPSLERLWISTAERVIAAAPAPVLTVRAPGTEALSCARRVVHEGPRRVGLEPLPNDRRQQTIPTSRAGAASRAWRAVAIAFVGATADAGATATAGRRGRSSTRDAVRVLWRHRGTATVQPDAGPSADRSREVHAQRRGLMRVIDGRRTVRARSAAMPVWGRVFEQGNGRRTRASRDSLRQVRCSPSSSRRSVAWSAPPRESLAVQPGDRRAGRSAGARVTAIEPAAADHPLLDRPDENDRDAISRRNSLRHRRGFVKISHAARKGRSPRIAADGQDHRTEQRRVRQCLRQQQVDAHRTATCPIWNRVRTANAASGVPFAAPIAAILPEQQPRQTA